MSPANRKHVLMTFVPLFAIAVVLNMALSAPAFTSVASEELKSIEGAADPAFIRVGLKCQRRPGWDVCNVESVELLCRGTCTRVPPGAGNPLLCVVPADPFCAECTPPFYQADICWPGGTSCTTAGEPYDIPCGPLIVGNCPAQNGGDCAAAGLPEGGVCYQPLGCNGSPNGECAPRSVQPCTP